MRCSVCGAVLPQEVEEGGRLHIWDVNLRLALRQVTVKHGAEHRTPDGQDVLREEETRVFYNVSAVDAVTVDTELDREPHLMCGNSVRVSRGTDNKMDVCHPFVIKHRGVSVERNR